LQENSNIKKYLIYAIMTNPSIDKTFILY